METMLKFEKNFTLDTVIAEDMNSGTLYSFGDCIAFLTKNERLKDKIETLESKVQNLHRALARLAQDE